VVGHRIHAVVGACVTLGDCRHRTRIRWKWLAVHVCLDRGYVTIANSGIRGKDVIDLIEDLLRKREIYSRCIHLEIFRMLGAWDRDDIVALGEYPCQCELAGGDAEFRGQFFDFLNQL